MTRATEGTGFTEIASASPEASGGAFTGCFAAAARGCYEGIAVSKGNSPFGPYNVYYLNANYNTAEPGHPSLLNDFAKIGVTRDAFLMFYDEFPLSSSAPGFGGGLFNGAQEFAFDKSALEQGRPVKLSNGQPNPNFNVARENMGRMPTPDGTCAGSAGVDCWAAVIPAQPADAGQYDNHNDGTGFMTGALDFNSFAELPASGDNRIAVWDWTGLRNLNSSSCGSCRSQPEHRLRPADVDIAGPDRVGDQYRGRRAVATGLLQRVPGLPRTNPASLGDYSWAIFLPVFKTGRAGQPPAWKVRFLRRVVARGALPTRTEGTPARARDAPGGVSPAR